MPSNLEWSLPDSVKIMQSAGVYYQLGRFGDSERLYGVFQKEHSSFPQDGESVRMNESYMSFEIHLDDAAIMAHEIRNGTYP